MLPTEVNGARHVRHWLAFSAHPSPTTLSSLRAAFYKLTYRRQDIT